MSQLRQNPLTKEWVIIATDRAKRPDQLRRSQERKPHHASSAQIRKDEIPK
jgi:galactose-1-phosphate uridylyltransferase